MDVNDDEPLVLSQEHAALCHERWVSRMNRPWSEVTDDVRDTWTTDQCGGCRFYIPVTGALASDWGVCSNDMSPFDGRVMFEHDGCDSYSGASEWVTGYLAASAHQDNA